MEKETNSETNINSYLSFKLNDEIFAVSVNKVLNILELVKITEVPKSPPYMKGVINLRGRVLPVIDTRIKFGLSPIEFTPDTCIIVINIIIDDEQVDVGSLVDSVQEVFEIDDTHIFPTPSIGAKYKSEFIDGMIKRDDKFIMLLNMDKIFSSNDLVMIQEHSEV